MACKLAIIGVLYLVYCTRSVYAAPGDACPDGATDCSAVNHEICNTDPKCECDASSYYAPSNADAAVCVINCALKNPTPDEYTITGTTEEGDTATVACAAGYDGTPTNTQLTCAETGDYDNGFAGCAAKGAGTTLLSMFNVVSMLAFILLVKQM